MTVLLQFAVPTEKRVKTRKGPRKTSAMTTTRGHGRASTKDGHFNVRALDPQLSVTYISGQIAYDANGRHAVLQQSDQLAVSDDGSVWATRT